jgi:hypothetical protein
MELWALGFASMRATTLPSVPGLKRHYSRLLTDFLKREEEGAMSLSGLVAMNCNHRMYGQL